jgi:hypothetical protein
VVQCDGEAFKFIAQDGAIVTCEPLDYWADLERIVDACGCASGINGLA